MIPIRAVSLYFVAEDVATTGEPVNRNQIRRQPMAISVPSEQKIEHPNDSTQRQGYVPATNSARAVAIFDT